MPGDGGRGALAGRPGNDQPAWRHRLLGPGPQCTPYQYWIHLDDKRWEVRDAQWLAGERELTIEPAFAGTAQ